MKAKELSDSSELFRSQAVAMKQLLEVYEKVALEQSGKLEQTLTDLRNSQEMLRKTLAETETMVKVRTAELSRLNAELGAANRLKDEILAMVSHDLRAPLTTILGWVEIALTDRNNAENQQHALEVIKRSAKTQARLIDDLLDISLIAAGKMRLEVEKIDLASMIITMIETMRPVANAKGVVLKTDCECNGGTIAVDIERLQQVISNLLSNAIKFTPAGGLVEIRLQQEDKYAVITVQDNGKGIVREFLPYVFDPFRQAENQRRCGGLGLGLAIVRQLVQMHGGTVSAESDGVDKGSQFTVRLPIVSNEMNTQLPASVCEQVKLNLKPH